MTSFLRIVCCTLIPFLSLASACCADEGTPTVETIKTAVGKSLPLLVKGAQGAMEKRKQCFTCHNQSLPIFALKVAGTRGFEVDADHLQQQLKLTADFLDKNKENYLKGEGQGGQVDMAGYAVWTLDVGGWKADATTAAVMEYILLRQKDLDHWEPVSHRPPSENSPFTTTYVALRGLKAFGAPEQKERIDLRFQQAREWLLKTETKETEDRVFRLRGLQLAGAGEEDLRLASKGLLDTQREDGGWSQLDDLESDAYATGSALVALHEAGGIAADNLAYRKGLAYLISTQREDGSWYVKSRSKPFQAYFESGYPHGKDQFISIAAAGWATMALGLALPTVDNPAATK